MTDPLRLPKEHLVEAVRARAERQRKARALPSLARNFGQIGMLGWQIVVPTLIAKDADLLVRGGSVAAAAGLRLTRLLMTTGVLLFSVLHGWQTLLAAALGFLLARQSVLVRHRDAP